MDGRVASSEAYSSMGSIFRKAVADAQKANVPLKLPGVPTAYCALLAQSIGYQAIYLSGSGVAASSLGLPDLAVTTLNDVLDDANRICSIVQLPLLVDVDTGFGTALNIARTVKTLERAGVAGIHIEDQIQAKRCGHRPGKQIVGTEEMVDRIKTAVSARKDPSFVIMARTDAYANEGLEGAIKRCMAYKDAGADMLFPEALKSLEEYQEIVRTVGLPVLANMTEWGKTPLFTAKELGSAGVAIALYPLSAFRAMSLAAMNIYSTILKEGTQCSVVNTMHTRQEIYDILQYDKFEKQMDELFGRPARNE